MSSGFTFYYDCSFWFWIKFKLIEFNLGMDGVGLQVKVGSLRGSNFKSFGFEVDSKGISYISGSILTLFIWL